MATVYSDQAYPPSDRIYVRQNMWSLETPNVWDPVSLAYARAVREMQSRDPTDPTSWIYQANIHGTYDPTPPGADWNQCQHASWFFLPWHRMYIYWFERIVRSIVIDQGGPADWALPYWNYSDSWPQQAALPPGFREQTLPDGSANPLLVENRNPVPPPGMNGGALLPQAPTSYAVAYSFTNFLPPPQPGFGSGPSAPTQFENATGALENQPHNIIHVLVGGPGDDECGGGWMSDAMCAARDPIFWLHHSNIDRLWTNWLALGGGRANPTDPAWLDQQFTFYDENGAQVVMKASDVLDTVTQLHYRYDDEAPPVARRAFAAREMVAAAGGNPPRLLAATEEPIELGSWPITVSVGLPEEAKAVMSRVAAAPAEAPNTHLNVEGIQIDRDPGVVYEIYLNFPEADETADPHTHHFVGYVTTFGAQHHPRAAEQHQAPGGLRHTYDITNLVYELTARGLWDEDRVTVTFVPRGLLPPPGAPPAPRVEAGPQPRVRIGRVSVSSE
ncbi:MAG: tyrosinase family protein [Actinomycetota bacterium]